MPPPAGQGRERGRSRPAEFPRAWLPGLHLALTGLFVAAFFAVPRLHAVAWALIGIEGLAAMLTGIALHRPARRTPWLLLAAGLATFVVTDAIENSQNADMPSSRPEALSLGLSRVLPHRRRAITRR